MRRGAIDRALGPLAAAVFVLAPPAWGQRQDPRPRSPVPAQAQAQAQATGGGRAGACLAPARVEAVTACGDVVRLGRGAGARVPVSQRAQQPEPAARRPEGPPAPVPQTGGGRVRALTQAQYELLERQATLTAALVRTTPARDPSRPAALLRLAQDLEDLARMDEGFARALDAPLHAARAANDAATAARLEREQAGHGARRRDHLTRLARALEAIVADHAQFPRLDEVLYALGHARGLLGDVAGARGAYQALVQRFPASTYVPAALIVFADQFFDRGELAEARDLYERVAGMNTPDNHLVGYALYRLAWVQYNQRQFEPALATFFRVIEFARANPQDPSAGSIASAARRELVAAYGEVYGVSRPLAPSAAVETFRRYAPSDDAALELAERLGELYADRGQWPNATAVYHELMSRRPASDRLCAWQAQVTRAAVASRPAAERVTEVARLLDVHDAYRAASSRRPQAARDACRDAAARIVYDVASHWHLEATGAPADPANPARAGTRDPQTLARAQRMYAALLEHFPDLDRVEFPELDRRDWPTRYRVAYYRASLLSAQRDPCACGPAFDQVADMDPRGALAEDAAYQAVVCYNECFAERTARAPRPQAQTDVVAASGAAAPPRAARRELDAEERAMDRAFGRYVCFAEQAPAAALAAGASAGGSPATDLLTVRYRRAYLHYRANRFDEAAALFRAVAFSDRGVPDPENLRELAGELYLDALNGLGRLADPPRPQCYDVMAEDVARLRERACGAGAPTAGRAADFCAHLADLGCDVGRLRAESLAAARRYREAARGVLALVRGGACARRVDEMLFNATLWLDAANLLGRAMRVREVLVERFLPPPHRSPYAQRALLRLAGNYHAIQVYGRAAELYERYARFVAENHGAAVAAERDAVAQAADALRQATVFRIGLGDEAQALANAEAFSRTFGSDPALRRQAASVVFAIGQVYQDRAARLAARSERGADDRARRDAAVRDAWSAVVAHYTSFVNRYARNGTLDQQIRGNVALGRGYWHLGDAAHAQLYFRAAAAAWGDEPAARAGEPSRPRAEERLTRELGADAPDAIARSREAVAEARFYLAEASYQRFIARRMPAYRGGGSMAAYRRWEQRVFTPYLTEQRRALEEVATPQYQALIRMRVPNWEIAAYQRLGHMFYQLAQLVREAPVPPGIQANPDLLAAYHQAVEAYTREFTATARAGFEGCIRRSTDAHWFNEWSQRCELSLNAIDRRQYPLADEVRVEPNLVYSRAANARPVYEVNAAAEADE